MPSAFVFQLTDARFAPSFELIRRVAQPLSSSTPHITVRYPVDRLSIADLSMYESARVNSMEFVAPATFSERGTSGVSTVFIKCRSETLEALSYKPDFPDSIFHLSLYDGPPSNFAAAVLEVLSQFPWHLHADFEPSALRRIPIGRSKPKVSREHVQLSADALAVLRGVGLDLQPDELLELKDDGRLEIISRVTERLHSNDGAAPKPSPTLSRVSKAPLTEHEVQPDLWGEVSIDGTGRRDALLSGSARRAISEGHRPVGLFLTPPELAQDLVSAGVEAHAARNWIDFGDPAIGSGIFFASLLRNVDPSRIRSAFGVELDVRRAKVTADRWSARNLTVLTGAFPEVELERESRSLIIANPPYVRSQNLDPETTNRWRQQIQHDLDMPISGRSDLYVYMVLASHRWMMPGAIAVWLLPSEFGQTQYGQVLRAYLTSRVQLLRVHSFSSAVPLFENARVSSTAVVFQNRSPEPSVQIAVSQGGTLAKPDRVQHLSYRTLGRMTKWGAQAWLPSRNAENHFRLGDLFKVRRGIATGANSRFILDSNEVAALGIPRRWRKPVVPKSRSLQSDVIEVLSNGDPAISPITWLIDCEASIAEIRNVAPAFADYLLGIEEEVLASRLVRSRKPFYSQEKFQPSPFLFSSMSRSTRSGARRGPFFLNRSSAVNLNNYHSLYPRFAMDRLSEAELDDIEILRLLLTIDEDEFTREGRVYVSGLRKVEPRELPELRLRHVPARLLELVNSP